MIARGADARQDDGCGVILERLPKVRGPFGVRAFDVDLPRPLGELRESFPPRLVMYPTGNLLSTTTKHTLILLNKISLRCYITRPSGNDLPKLYKRLGITS